MPTTQKQKAEIFANLHSDSGAFIIPNPWDAGTARMLATLGFPALATTSAGFAFSLGRRDGEGLVSREEVLQHARAIIAATDLPVAADLENGFGDTPEAAAETIRLAAEAGLVGGSIEDATGNVSQPIYPHTQAVERVAAAVEAARALPFRFTLTARGENLLHGRYDLDDTIRRLQAFAAAGADVVFAPGLPTLDAVKTVCAAVAPTPVNVLASNWSADLSLADMAAAGVRRVSIGSGLSRIALTGFWNAAREMKDQGTFTFTRLALPFAQVNDLMQGR
jgi:2-methylisocitrate lyase-like PEP mutase family enzyme